MFRDFYLQMANEMYEYAEERLNEAKKFTEKAEYYVKMADELEPEEVFSCLRSIRRENNITAKKIAKNMDVAESTVTQSLNKSKNISFAKLTRFLEAMNLDLIIFDPKGKPHKLAKREYVSSKVPYLTGKRGGLLKRDDSPEVFFK